MYSGKNLLIILLLLFISGCSKDDSNPVENQSTKLTGTITDVIGLPVENVKIYTDPESETVATNQSGMFEIKNISSGFYRVFAEKDGFQKESINTGVRHNETTDLQITLRILMNISGRVTDDSTREGIGGVKVSIDKYSKEVTTVNDGSYQLNNIPAGTNIITLSKTGYVFKKASINILPDKPVGYDVGISKLLPLEMVFVEGGTFQMGDTFGDGNPSEKPAHQVLLSSFYISKTEITQKQWTEITSGNPAKYWGDDQPVESISWKDAVNYCNSRSSLEGLTPCYTIFNGNITCDFNADGYRLPTEAEWEYAARSGKTNNNFKYSGSSDVNEVAWYDKNSSNITHPVAQKKSNDLGIYDMSGNVWEFCWDYYDENYYAQSQQQNPTGPATGQYRVLRGGAWSDDAYFNKIYYRNYYQENSRGTNVGLRVVRTAK